MKPDSNHPEPTTDRDAGARKRRAPVFVLITALAGLGGCAADRSPAPDFAPTAAVSRRLVEAVALPRSSVGGPDELRQLRRTREWIVEQLEAMGYAPVIEPIDDTDWHNVYVEIPSSSDHADVLVVGAHFDTVSGSPGADDNASGVAGLLQLAWALRNDRPSMTIRLVFFNLEEAGLFGSEAHLRHALSRGERIVGMVSIEMIGYYSDAPDSQTSPIPRIPGIFEPPTVGDCIVLVGVQNSAEFVNRFDAAMRAAEPALKTYPFAFAPGDGSLTPDVRRSDHAPFLDAGIPAFMLTDTANFRNPHYHAPTDLSDTLDYERMATTVRGLIGAVRTVAESEPSSDR